MIHELREEIVGTESLDNEKWQRTVDTYRRCFNTPDGQEVLMDILNDLGFFSNEIVEPQEVVLQNYARILFAKCGAWNPERIPGIMKALLKEE